MMDTEGRDEELVELLRRALLEREQPPEAVVRAAKEAWTWRTIDAELAALSYDSLLDDEALAGVRGIGAARTLAFEAEDIIVEIEVTEDGDRRILVGQVVPAVTADVTIEGADGRQPLVVTTDHLGRFRAERVGSGVVRLRIGESLVTSWLPI
jgi:hypothetical protein